MPGQAFGVIGLEVMGRNIALNIERNGFPIAVFNRTYAKTEAFLANEAKGGIKTSHKSLINVYLPGGPPHQDMWDLKPDAPDEVRGEFKPIATKVPGIQICELFPKIAAMMDKFVAIRSLVGSSGDHDAYQCMTGRPRTPANNGFWPALSASP